MITKIDKGVLKSQGYELSGNINQLDIDKSLLEPPFVFSENIAPNYALKIKAFSYIQGEDLL